MTPRISIITSIYKGEEYIEGFLSSLVKQTIYPDCELIFILNEPSNSEKKLLDKFKDNCRINCIIVDLLQRESLAASWNRGINLANGKYISLWNIDDRRIKNSLEIQVNLLENYPGVCMVYGDFIETSSFTYLNGSRYITPEFNPTIFVRRFACGGAFLVFRKNVFSKYGYFDEQFSVALDYEFVVRLAFSNEKFIKAQDILGYFYNNQTGLSTIKNSIVSDHERNIIYHRYAIYDKVQHISLDVLEKYEIESIYNFGKKLNLQDFGITPDYSKKNSLIFKSFIYLKKGLIFFLRKLGIWNWALDVRDHLFGFKK